MSAYRKTLIETCKTLSSINTEILTNAINIAMIGELKDINSTFDEGDIYSFDIEQLKDSKDINVNKLVALYMDIEELTSSLMNINNIKETNL